MQYSQDLELIDQIKTQVEKGDFSAFETLVDEYKAMVYSIGLRITRRMEEAEEAAQDTFIKVLKSLGKYNGKAKLSSWIYRIAYNTALDYLKKNKKHQVLDHIDEVPVADVSNDIVAGLEQKELAKSIKTCLNLLPATDALILTFFYYEDLKIEEISKIMKLSVSNVKVKLYRSRKKLHDLMIDKIEPQLLEAYDKAERR